MRSGCPEARDERCEVLFLKLLQSCHRYHSNAVCKCRRTTTPTTTTPHTRHRIPRTQQRRSPSRITMTERFYRCRGSGILIRRRTRLALRLATAKVTFCPTVESSRFVPCTPLRRRSSIIVGRGAWTISWSSSAFEMSTPSRLVSSFCAIQGGQSFSA